MHKCRLRQDAGCDPCQTGASTPQTQVLIISRVLNNRIEIDLASQELVLSRAGRTLLSAPISSALNGAGEENGSGCTPRGLHAIRLRIGAGEPLNRVFSGRRPTAEIYSPQLAEQYPERDWILTRILWLTGREPGFNRGGARDTLRRFIYIHGCPDSVPMGVPRSHGCIRMRNDDLLRLFDQVAAGTDVLIQERPIG